MRTKSIALLSAIFFFAACSPRDFLSRRLATDLIATSDAFTAPQKFSLQTGVLSNQDYSSPEYLVLEQHGWISATSTRCTAGLTAPCWDVLLTPAGVETIRTLLPVDVADKPLLPIPVAKRDFITVTGITKQGSVADVEFLWKWTPSNEIGAALYSPDLRYKSTVGFRNFDDGWHMVQTTPHSGQPLDEALKTAEPAP